MSEVDRLMFLLEEIQVLKDKLQPHDLRELILQYEYVLYRVEEVKAKLKNKEKQAA